MGLLGVNMRSIVFFVISLYLTGCSVEDSDTGDSAAVYGQDSSSRLERGWRPVSVRP
jgi:hypothetical protein